MNIWVGMRVLWTSIPSGTSPEDKYCKEEAESKDGPWNQFLSKVIETKAVYYEKFVILGQTTPSRASTQP